MSRRASILALLFAVALLPRLFGALSFGADLDGPGTFRMVNYDEGGSCRALLGGRAYPTFIGHQVLAIARVLGHPPSADMRGDPKGRHYCHSRRIILLQRSYSAVTGAATVVLLAWMALLMWPREPRIAWTAGALLAFSNFHVAQSHWGTADAPQVFFVTAFAAALTWAVMRGGGVRLAIALLLLIPALWAKWYFFALFSFAALVPGFDWRRHALPALGAAAVVAAGFVLAIGWEPFTEAVARRSYLLWGNEETRFGTGYAQIGTWRRWIRNAVNLPVVHVVGLGALAAAFVPLGLRAAWRDRERRRAWAVHAHALAYAAYMLLLGPVTYYRHYLPLFPTVALLAAYGFWRSGFSRFAWLVVLFVLYPLLPLLDSERSYLDAPRRELRAWYAAQPGRPRLAATFYVEPPRHARWAPFPAARYAEEGVSALGDVDFVVLSENWTDTSYANELNGPIAWNPEWLIKTRPPLVRTYRRIQAGEDPHLRLVARYPLRPFTPELWLHRQLYGSFQLFVGDIEIYRVVRDPPGGPGKAATEPG